MTTPTIGELIEERSEALIAALHNEDLTTLRRLRDSSTDEEEHEDIVGYIRGIETSEWAYDRAIGN